jgi:predicted phage tail protein
MSSVLPWQALRRPCGLLEANFPNVFSGVLKEGAYQVIVGEPDAGVYCNEEFLNFPFPDGAIHFVPVLAGSGMGKGMIMAIIGVSILAIALTGGAAAGGLLAGVGVEGAAGAVGLGAGLGTSIFGTGLTWGTVALAGAAVAFAGISIMLTPTPSTPAAAAAELGSFFFNGATNTVKEGVVVPLVYGRVIAGSVVVAAGISTEKFDVVSQGFGSPEITEALKTAFGQIF